MTVARPSAARAELVFPWPEPLSANEQVVVEADDACVSMQNGVVLGIFEPGEHRLPGEIPAGVELYFCSTRPQVGVKFGGPTSQGMVFGDFGFRVVEPHRLVIQVAAMGHAPGFEQYLGKTVMQALKEVLGLVAASETDEVRAQAASRLGERWSSLGVGFEGFGTLTIR